MSRKLLPQQSHLQWSSSHNNHTFSEAPPTTSTPPVKLLPQQSHLQWSSSHNNHSFSQAPPTTITASVKLLPHLQWSSSHNNHIFSEAPPTIITPSVKLLPLQFSNKCWNISISLQVKTSIRASVWSEICRDRVYWRTERTWEIQNPAEWNTLKNKQVCVYSWFFSNESEKQ